MGICIKPLLDPYGRQITSLRISVTSKCNMHCIYCHGEGEVHCGEKEISKEDIVRIVSVATDYGINKIKFSGGEPLLREDLEEIISALPLSRLKDISLTTNGSLLAKRAKRLKEAGLNRVNISLDTMKEEKYCFITNCQDGSFSKVLRGIEEALDAGLTPVKLNMVILKGVNEDEIQTMIEFVGGKPLVLQLIELMDFKNTARYHADISGIEEQLSQRADSVKINELHRRHKYFMNGAEVEVVRPVNNAIFCANCNRLRVTSDGKLKPCLLRNDNLVDFKGRSELEIHELIKRAVSLREPYNKPESCQAGCHR